MSEESRVETPVAEDFSIIGRREAIRRVSFLLGGITFVGGTSLLTACERDRAAGVDTTAAANFTADDVAFLDEVAETILPATKTPGAKAAKTGAFMARMVADSYDDNQQRIFRKGMRTLDAACKQANGASFMQATPAQRTALLERVDREQKKYMDAVDAAQHAREMEALRAGVKSDTAKTTVQEKAEAHLPGQRREASPESDVGPAAAITADSPAHYFRMMKELALLGYFTSEIGMTQAQRYVESPGHFEPCAPYHPGDKAWAPHA